MALSLFPSFRWIVETERLKSLATPPIEQPKSKSLLMFSGVQDNVRLCCWQKGHWIGAGNFWRCTGQGSIYYLLVSNSDMIRFKWTSSGSRPSMASFTYK